MASNHGNIYNELLALVQGRYEVLHVEVNGTGARVGDRNGISSGAGRSGQYGTGNMGEGRGWHTGDRKAVEEGGCG